MVKRISNQAREEIVARLERGLSVLAAAAEMNVSRTTVSRIRQTLEWSLPCVKSGGPSALGEQERKRVVKWLESGVCSQAVDGVARAQEALGVTVTTFVIRSALKEHGFRACARIKKPLISQRNRKAMDGFYVQALRRHS